MTMVKAKIYGLAKKTLNPEHSKADIGLIKLPYSLTETCYSLFTYLNTLLRRESPCFGRYF